MQSSNVKTNISTAFAYVSENVMPLVYMIMSAYCNGDNQERISGGDLLFSRQKITSHCIIKQNFESSIESKTVIYSGHSYYCSIAQHHSIYL